MLICVYCSRLHIIIVVVAKWCDDGVGGGDGTGQAAHQESAPQTRLAEPTGTPAVPSKCKQNTSLPEHKAFQLYDRQSVYFKRYKIKAHFKI